MPNKDRPKNSIGLFSSIIFCCNIPKYQFRARQNIVDYYTYKN